MNDIHPRTTGPRRENIDVERLKSSIRLSDIVSRYTELRQSGRSRIGLCPFHADTDPSFVVTDELGVFYCHGCRASGDVIDFVRAIQRIGFVDAVRYISGAIPAFTIPYERERARKLDRAKRALAGAYARCQWNDAKAIEGTPAERYLRAGNHMRAPVHAALRHRADLDRPIDRPEKPDLPGADRRLPGRPRPHRPRPAHLPRAGRHSRTFAPAEAQPGRHQGRRPASWAGSTRMVVCEGPEDGLTLYQMHPGTSVWVALGSGNMPFIQFPPGVKRILVAGDNNPAGYKAAQDACEAFQSQGLEVEPIFPAAEFEDFNDELRGISKLDQSR